MLTEEQIKSLKKGDKLIAEVSFSSVCKDNDLLCNAPFTSVTGDIMCGGIPFHPSCLTLPPTKPKYDPCRLFKKGDRVRVVEWQGRDIARVGMMGKVVSDEYNSIVELTIDGCGEEIFSPACHLELVTPVEDIEPYSVIDSPQTYNIVQAGVKGFTATFYKNQPLAKQEAESYCKRLNDEWRKKNESNIKENRA